MQAGITVGTGAEIVLEELREETEISTCLGNVGLLVTYFRVDWIEIRGTKYQPGMYVLV